MPKPPRDETLTESPAGGGAPLVRPEAHVFVALECDRPLAGAARSSLRGIDEVAVGRGDERGARREGKRLELRLPSGWMSSAHARIRRESGGWRLEDLGSRNGTRVNGVAVVHRILADGDLIELGHSILLFRAQLHAPPDAPLDLDAGTAAFPAPGLRTLVPAFAQEIDALVRIAASPVPLLLRGETGTGKELVARAVHALSKRTGPFVAVNAAAIPDALVESQLFGHAKGAFSGAHRDEPGFVRAADGGTLFLDEIGDLKPSSQAALLRVLQEGEVVPVGNTRAVRVDLRVVAATHQPLEALVARGSFRSDLFARLDGFTFALPRLCERREDVGLIVADILRSVRPDLTSPFRFAPDAGRALLRYAWPLNIRELHHCLARAIALTPSEGILELSHLPKQVALAASAETTAEEVEPGENVDQDARLRAQLDTLLTAHEGNVAEVARAMGKARMQVHRWMKRYELDPKAYRR